MRAFPVQMPSGVRYWTVIYEELRVMPVADAYLRHVRFGRDGAESTTKTYAGAVALYLAWCTTSGEDWRAAVGRMPSLVLWLGHVPWRRSPPCTLGPRCTAGNLTAPHRRTGPGRPLRGDHPQHSRRRPAVVAHRGPRHGRRRANEPDNRTSRKIEPTSRPNRKPPARPSTDVSSRSPLPKSVDSSTSFTTGEHAVARGLEWSTWRRWLQAQARRAHVRRHLQLQTLMI
jgi:hypothetical protein